MIVDDRSDVGVDADAAQEDCPVCEGVGIDPLHVREQCSTEALSSDVLTYEFDGHAYQHAATIAPTAP